MKYLFRDRIPKERGLATYVKLSGDTHPDHHDYHPHYELYFRRTPLPQEIVLNGESFFVDGPAAVLTAPYQIHAMSPRPEVAQFERHVIYFDESVIQRLTPLLSNGFFEKSRNCLFLLSQKDAHVIENTLPSVFDSTLPEQERLLALGLLFSRLDRLTPPEMRHSFGQVKTYIPQVLRHLNEHIEGRLSADEIAARFHVSRAKLDRDFRASVGQSLHGAIMDLRLSRAMRLLREGVQSVAGVAQLCGFASEEYFYSFFKRATGQTPLQYRNALQ